MRAGVRPAPARCTFLYSHIWSQRSPSEGFLAFTSMLLAWSVHAPAHCCDCHHMDSATLCSGMRNIVARRFITSSCKCQWSVSSFAGQSLQGIISYHPMPGLLPAPSLHEHECICSPWCYNCFQGMVGVDQCNAKYSNDWTLTNPFLLH